MVFSTNLRSKSSSVELSIIHGKVLMQEILYHGAVKIEVKFNKYSTFLKQKKKMKKKKKKIACGKHLNIHNLPVGA